MAYRLLRYYLRRYYADRLPTARDRGVTPFAAVRLGCAAWPEYCCSHIHVSPRQRPSRKPVNCAHADGIGPPERIKFNRRPRYGLYAGSSTLDARW